MARAVLLIAARLHSCCPIHSRICPRPPPSTLSTNLQGDALGRGQLRLHPAWLQLVAEDGKILYLHRLR